MGNTVTYAAPDISLPMEGTDMSWGGGLLGQAGGYTGGSNYSPNYGGQSAGEMGPFEWEMNTGGADYSPSELGPFNTDTGMAGGYDLGGDTGNLSGYGEYTGQGYTPTSSDVNALYGSSGYGEGDSSFKGNEFLQKYKNAVSPYQSFLKNPLISTLMGLHPVTAMLKTALGGPTSVGGFLGSMFGSTPIGRLAGGFVGSQLGNYATEGSFAPMNSQNIGGLAGSVLGIASGNPYAASLGGLAGKELGGMDYSSMLGSPTGGQTGALPPGYQQATQAQGGLSQMMPAQGQNPNLLSSDLNTSLAGGLATGLLGLNNNRSLNNQINSLQGLYGQNSSYAQAMRQQLERRDAAAGRRSQYGPREVELQAALAGNASKLAPSLQQLYGQKMNNTNLVAQTLLRNPGVISSLKNGFKDLSSLFNQPGSTVPSNPVWNNGGFQSGTEGMGD